MRADIWLGDVKGLLSSRRTTYSLVIMAVLALIMAIIVRFSPEDLRIALEASAPGSSGLFEYLWVVDVLSTILLLIFVGFGSFAVCDLEDEKATELVYSRARSRSEIVLGRLFSSLASLLIVYTIGSCIVAAIGASIVGELDVSLFILHQVMVLPMCLFVFSLTFFLSVPLSTTALTAIGSFGASLALSFAYTFQLMGGDAAPSDLNPLALGYRVLVGLPLEFAAGMALLISTLLLAIGFLWFKKKDI